MKSSQVRDLARRYATGKLSQESYRSQRRSLIDSITADQVHLAYRQDERAASRRSRLNTKSLGLMMVAVVVAGICVALLMRHGGKGHGAQAAANAAPAAPPAAPGPDLVQQFVDANDWTDGNIQNFERRWISLGTDEQAKARDSATYPRLLSSVRLQITSEKAVAGDDVAKDPHLAELQKLAKTLGTAAGP